MGKKDAVKKAATKARQEVKQSKASKKLAKKDARAVGEDDIEKILAEIIAKEALKTVINVNVCNTPPSARANFSMTSLPNGDLVMFGGEYFDGEDTFCYNDLYRWNIERREWKCIESPNTPPPRCSHQAVYYRDFVYIFGGEFATTEQFHHYRDFWRLDVKSNAWEKLDPRGRSPSARSGHRMSIWRNFLLLFGGFYEAAREVRWYNDLYVLNFQDLTWRKIEFPLTAIQPSPRSGHQIAVHENASLLFLYGGYSKIKESGKKSEAKVHNDFWVLNLQPLLNGAVPIWDRIGKKGTPPTSRSGASMVVHKNRALLFGGVADKEGGQNEILSQFYNDLYAFDMDRRQWFKLQLKAKKGGTSRRKKKAEGDTKESEIGGVEDNMDYIDSEDEIVEDTDQNENAFVYIDAQGKLMFVEHATEDKDMDDKEDTVEDVAPMDIEPCIASTVEGNLGETENSGGKLQGDSQGMAREIVGVHAEYMGDVVSSFKVQDEKRGNLGGNSVGQMEVEAQGPLPRINPSLAVRGNTLYVYGGILEVHDREYTLDDCWSIDLNSRVEWTNVQAGRMDEQIWKEEETSERSSDTGEMDDSEDDYEILKDEPEWDPNLSISGMTCLSIEGTDLHNHADPVKDKGSRKESKKARGEGIREEMRRLQDQLGADDPNKTPLAKETLRDFYARTTNYWAEQFLLEMQNGGTEDRGVHQKFSEKELRRDAFAMAELRYQQIEPALQRLNELETEQAEMEAKQAEKKALKKKDHDKSRR